MTEPILKISNVSKNFGEIKFKGTYYKSTSDMEISKGETVKVVDKGDVQGSYYIVKKIN